MPEMSDEAKTFLTVVKRIFIGVVGVVLFFGSWFIVSPGEVGVTYSRVSGQTSSHSQGLGLKLPLLTGVQKFDVQTQRVDIKSESASFDLQKVNVEVALNYFLVYDKVNELFVRVGADYVAKVVVPAVNEAVKAGTAQLPVEKIIQNRELLKKSIEDMLSTRLAGYNIHLESVNLVNITFDDKFNGVVEDKQIEEQKIKTAEYIRRQAEENKKATILNAEAQAESQRLQRSTLTPDLVQIEWIKKWNGVLPTYMMGDKSLLMVQPKDK